MPATITSVTPDTAEPGTTGISIVGTGFVDDPSLSTIWFRFHGDSVWKAVAPVRVTFVSATELTFDIDEANTDGWTDGWHDIGVADFGDETPDAFLQSALRYEEGLMAVITDVKPSYGKAAGTITIIGTGFVDTPTLTEVYVRKTGETAWDMLPDASVAFVSATELTVTIALIDGWVGGLCDIGVADDAAGEPESELLGAVFFYTAGVFDPDAVIKGAPKEIYIAGVFMGHAHGNLDLEHEVETSDIEVNESLVPVRTIKVGESFGLSIPLAEVTLEHIKEVWGISAEIVNLTDGRRRLTFGGDATVLEKSVMLILPAASGKQFALTFYRCAILAAGTLSWGKDDQVDLPLEVTVLADTSRAIGDRVGRFEEYTLAE